MHGRDVVPRQRVRVQAVFEQLHGKLQRQVAGREEHLLSRCALAVDEADSLQHAAGGHRLHPS